MKSDQAFLADLDRSNESARLTHAMLLSRRVCAQLMPVHKRESYAKRHAYADSGDIHIKRRVEVKHRKTINFTCAEDFPFPTIIVEECHHIERGFPPLEGIYIWNAALTHYVYISVATRLHWKVRTRFVPEAQRECDFFEVPTNLPLLQWGKRNG